MLMEKAKTEIFKKLNQWSIVAKLGPANKKNINMEKEKPPAVSDMKIKTINVLRFIVPARYPSLRSLVCVMALVS